MTETYLTTEEVSEILRVAPDWVAKQCKAKRLKATKLGTTWRISPAAVELFMAGEVPPARKRLSARQQRRATA